MTDRIVGRCEMFDEIATGGMATIHLGRMLGAESFSRTVAVKRLHRQYALDPDFVAMFLDEARIVARIRHPNVVPILDLVEEEGDLFILMEYVEGINFGQLGAAAKELGERVPPGVAARIVTGALNGLHAAHDATNEKGQALGIVHRDVSPENIFVGVDGFARVLDFGVARARGRSSASRSGELKGRLSYLAPEQLLGEPLDRRTDVFAVSTVLWQALTGLKLFEAADVRELKYKLTEAPMVAPSQAVPELPTKYDAIIMRGLERKPARRWKSAQAMAEALEAIGGLAPHREVGQWVRRLGAARLAELASKVSVLERKPVAKRSKAGRRVHQRSELRIPIAELAAAAASAEAEAAAELAAAKLEDSGEVALPVSPALARRSGEYPASIRDAVEPGADAPPGTGLGRGTVEADAAVDAALPPALAGRRRLVLATGVTGGLLVGIGIVALVAWLVFGGGSSTPEQASPPERSAAASATAPPDAGATTSPSARATGVRSVLPAEPSGTAAADASVTPTSTARATRRGGAGSSKPPKKDLYRRD
jgi:tRNA A-37 threonylcarbamoyl transferase component Bud32